MNKDGIFRLGVNFRRLVFVVLLDIVIDLERRVVFFSFFLVVILDLVL